ncbi:hypothetical protein F5Y07DRAFT_359636 [Xylaria sp. FL0933]|nr:hypothetical protein F5Y07DRAFT_359636 [Xylaria sp. FL0933]
MSSMSRNNSVNSLMGFSVHQPTLGSPLQFFPAMGSKQLDEMIDAYVPGNASILDKRAAVSMEFFEHTMATGDLFKFFMVYPALGLSNTSPTMDSGYHSNFTTSPVMSESQWNNTLSRTTSPPSTKKSSPANDFSHLPGMKIMTKDGRDVTNSASRGCKTKEQRDHAHLMRIIKACDSCRRKKTKCDPSHKRPAAGTSSGRITKKASKNPRPAASPPQTATNEDSTSIDFDQILSGTSFDSFAESLNVPADGFSMEWDQFIQYDEEPTETIPYDYDFFLDPAGFFSPATTTSFASSSTSPSQLPITPIERDVNIVDPTTEGHDHKPILPYLNPGGVVEAGSNYVDFNLYSPESSFLDEDLDMAKEIAASPIRSPQLNRHRLKRTNVRQEAISDVAAANVGDNAVYDETMCSYPQNVIPDATRGSLFRDSSSHVIESSYPESVLEASDRGRAPDPQQANLAPDRQAERGAAALATPAALSIVDDVLESVTSEGLYGRETIYEQLPSIPSQTDGRLQSPIVMRTAEHGTERQKEAYAVSPKMEHIHSADAASITQINSSSPQPCVDQSYADLRSSTYPQISNPVELVRHASDLVVYGYDGDIAASRMTHADENTWLRSYGEDTMTSTVDRANLSTRMVRDGVMTMVRSSQLSTTRLELNVPQNDMHTVRSTAITNTAVQRVPRSSSSPLPSLVARSSDHVESWIYETNLQEAVEANGQRNGMDVGQQSGGSPISWESSSESQYHIGARQSFPALTNQLVLSDALATTAMIAALGLFSVVVSIPSLRITTTRSNDLVHSIVSVNVTWYTIAALLLCVAMCVFSLVYFLPIGALPVLAACIQPQQPDSALTANEQSSDLPPSHNPPNAKRPRVDFIDGLKATCADFMRVVRCDLAKKLTFETRPQTSTKIGLSSPKLPRSLQRWGMIPLA